MNRLTRIAVVLLLAAPLRAQEAGGAPGADPARFFPADTFAYVEVDAGAFEASLAEGQIGKILSDPGIRAFLKPALTELGIDAEKPVEDMLKKLRVKEVLEGRAAIGVRGLSFVCREAGGKEWRFRVSPEAPLDGRAVYRLIGLLTSLDLGDQNRTLEIDTDFLAVGKPGPLGKQWIEAALSGVKREAVKVAGRDATHVQLNVPTWAGFSYVFNFYAAEKDGAWFVASQTDVLAQALEGGPKAPLAGSAALAQARARVTSGRPVLLAHIDFAKLLDVGKGLVFPIAKEMSDIAGLSNLRGLALGMSFVDGGVRESLALMLEGEPKGVWRLFDAMPPGLRSIEVAPPGALAAVAVKLDPTILRERLRALLAEVVPGNEDQLESEILRELDRELRPFTMLGDFLPAIGDEAALFLFPGGTNEFPAFVFGLDGRDEEKLGKLVAKMRAEVREVSFEDVELEGGIKATRVFQPPYDTHFVIAKRHLFLASNPKLLAEVVTKWGGEGAPSLVRDDPTLPRVLKAVNGGDVRSMVALAYVNLSGSAKEALKWRGMWGRLLPDDVFDKDKLGNLDRVPDFLTGIAISLRRDREGLVLDTYGPIGLMLPGPVAAAVFVSVAVNPVPPPQRAMGKPTLGINNWSSDKGVKVIGLVAGGPAEAAGVRQGDRIIKLAGVAVTSIDDLRGELDKHKPGETVVLVVRRGDEEVPLNVELGGEAGW